MVRLAAALFLLATFQEGSVRLEPKLPIPGAKFTIEIHSALELKTTSRDATQESVRESSLQRTEKYSEEVLGVTEGIERAYRVTCDSSKVEHSAPNMDPEVASTELEGKTYTVTRTATTRTVVHEDGTPADEAPAVGGWEDFGRLLPQQEVKAGDQWTIEGADLGSLLSTGNLVNPRAAVKGKLERIDGTTAIISFSGSIAGVTADGLDLKFSLEGCELVFDTEKGRPSQISVRGTITGGKKVTQPYIPPGGVKPRQEEVGEIKVESKKFEVTVVYK